MRLKEAVGITLKKIRTLRGLSQEDFSIVSSRTYLSSLERGLKSVTLEKLEEIATVLNVHPSTIVVMAYSIKNPSITHNELLDNIRREIDKLIIPVK